MLKKLLKALVSASLVLTMAVSSVGAEEKTQVNFDLHAQTYDYGESINRITFTIDGIDADSVSKDTFKVVSSSNLPEGVTGDDMNFGVYNDIERTVTEATVDENGLVTLTLACSSSGTGEGTLSYAYPNIQKNMDVELTYEITQNTSIVVDGKTVEPGAIEYVQNEGYDNPEVEQFQLAECDDMSYYYYVPENADDGAEHPLIVWLHGFGEGGYDGLTTTSGLRANRAAVCFTQDDAQEIFGGAFVVAPQAQTSWIQDLFAKNYDQAILDIIEEMEAKYAVDASRIYIAGASSGGYATVWMASKYPDVFAAAVPICPGIAQSNIDAWGAEMPSDADISVLGTIPTWTIQAENDPSVPYEEGSKRLAEVCGDNIIFSSYEDVTVDGVSYNGHWSWIYFEHNLPEYNGTNIWQWMAQQTKAPIVSAKGSQQVVVTGDDWGCGVSKTIITLNRAIDAASVSADDFTVYEEKNVVTSWTTYPYPTGLATTKRTILAAYACDKDGNEVTTASNKIAIDMYISPSEGSPMIYTGRNNWVDTYNLYVRLNNGQNLTSGANVINKLNINEEINDIGTSRLCPQLDGYAYGTYSDANGGTTSYALYSPAKDDHKNALIVWNHGAGEYGTDVQIDLLCNEVTAYSSDAFQEVMDGAYVLVPQRRSGGDDATTTQTVAELIEKVLAENPDIDPDRVIEGGCSAGGYFTLQLEIDYPDLFAASFPICPAKTLTEEEAEVVKDIPTWFTHCTIDNTVKFACSEGSIAALEAVGAKEIHTSFYDDVHDTTGRFFDTAEDGSQVAHQYATHWSWIYADNDTNVCDDETCNGLTMWQWMSQQVRGAETTGTQTIVITGDDWGCGVDKTIVKLNKAIDPESVSAEDFRVVEEKLAVTDWTTSPYTTGVVKADRTVTAAYTCDAEGNKTDKASEYVAIEMYISPSDGSPYIYTGRNNMADPYNLYVTLVAGETLTSGEETIRKITVDPEYTDTIQPVADVYTKYEFTSSDDITYSVAAYAPEEDDAKNALIIWLHGGGEGGTDANVPLLANEAGKLASDYINEEYFDGAYVLVPQCPTMWMDGYDYTADDPSDTHSIYTASLMELIKDYVAKNPDIDTDRIYIGGCSNGGYMTLEMILTYPDYFAAAFPICMGYVGKTLTTEQAESIKDIPMFFTFAKNDTTLDPDIYSLPFIAKLEEVGATNLHIFNPDDVHDTTGRFYDTEEDGTKVAHQYAGHWSWTYAFNDEDHCDDCGVDLWAWLAAQTKATTPVEPDAGNTGGETGGSTGGNSGSQTGTVVPNTGLYGASASLIAVAGLAVVVALKKRRH